MNSQAAKNANFLQYLHNAPKSVKAPIVKSCGKGETLALCECVDNVLRSNIRLTKKEYNKLAKHKDVLRKIRSTKGSWEKRKKVIQKGDGIPAIAAILSVVVPALIEIIKQK